MDKITIGIILLVCIGASFVVTNVDRYKNWKDQDNFMKFAMIYLGFIFVFFFLILIVIFVFDN